jgi:ubiquinone/menaquinone biosynthesis C-methylase UbiE
MLFRRRAFPRNYFEQLFVTSDDPWIYESEHQQERLELLLSSMRLAECPVLEIGCAEGHFTQRMAERYPEIVAMDLSIQALKRARDRIASDRVKFLQGDLLNLPFSKPFNTIVCAGVLVYFTEENLFQQAVSQIDRVLAPHGFLVIENMWEKSAGNLSGELIHNHLCSHTDLALVEITKRHEYGISVFQRKDTKMQR